MTELANIQLRIGETNEAHGFNELDSIPAQYQHLYVGNKLMLIVSELAEAQDELRSGYGVTETYYPTSQSGLGDVPGVHKPEGLPSELADVVIRAFGLAYEAGIDLSAAIYEKMAYNDTRPYKHGRKF
jgi:NTP pyrophosphatase (non-canonical NTP hydrolase)